MTSRRRRDPYVVLGVSRQASAAEIARAYRHAARASHPDSGIAGSAEQFRVVSDAYDELRDPQRRALYDRSHPLARPTTVETPGGTVRYLAPGSQHVVLGRSEFLVLPRDRSSFGGEGRSLRLRGNIDDLARLALSLLRSRGCL